MGKFISHRRSGRGRKRKRSVTCDPEIESPPEEAVVPRPGRGADEESTAGNEKADGRARVSEFPVEAGTEGERAREKGRRRVRKPRRQGADGVRLVGDSGSEEGPRRGVEALGCKSTGRGAHDKLTRALGGAIAKIGPGLTDEGARGRLRVCRDRAPKTRGQETGPCPVVGGEGDVERRGETRRPRRRPWRERGAGGQDEDEAAEECSPAERTTGEGVHGRSMLPLRGVVRRWRNSRRFRPFCHLILLPLRRVFSTSSPPPSVISENWHPG